MEIKFIILILFLIKKNVVDIINDINFTGNTIYSSRRSYIKFVSFVWVFFICDP